MIAEMTIIIESPFEETMKVKKKIDMRIYEDIHPVDVVEDPIVRDIVGGVSQRYYKKTLKRRENYSEYIAVEIANNLVDMWKTRDLENGYPKDQ